MKLNKLGKKVIVKNIIVAFLVLVVHLIALFSSPFFLGTNYSKKVLLDEFCEGNSNGNSLVVKAQLSHESCSYENILSYKDNYDLEYNTALGIVVSRASINENECSLVSATISESNKHYNNYRVYTDNSWEYLDYDNYIYVPKSMISNLVSTPQNILNVDVDISINGNLYPFKIGGWYNDSITDGGWRSRGKYFNDSFANCIFINESFLSDKFDCAFEMITSDSVDSGNVYDKFVDLVSKYGGSMLGSKDLKERKLLGELALLDKTGRSKIIQVLFVVISSMLIIFILCVSVCLFDVSNIAVTKRGIAIFVWGAIYYVMSCVFVLFTKNKIIRLLGFNAYGGNKALLNIVVIFFVCFFAAVLLKTYLKHKKQQIELNGGYKKSSNNIVFITKAKFPDDNAFATYVGGIASIYKKSGYDVVCVGNGNTKRNQVIESYFGNYVSVRSSKNSFVSKVLSQLFFECRVYNYLLNNFEKPLHIFFSCEFSRGFYKKIKKIYPDVRCSFVITEEFTKDEFEKYNLLSRRSIRINHYFLEKYYDKDDSFIAISKYLSNKIKDKKMECVYLPFVFNFEYVLSLKKEPIKHGGINYIYCGSPENKDLLPTIINAFSSLGKRSYKNDIHLHVIGVDEKWTAKHNVTSYDRNIISFYGRRNKEFVVNKYAECDYSVLLRDENKTFAKAGFPTKISESMVFGVVPITNLSSNLSDYLNDKNSIIVNGHEVEAFADAIDISVSEFKKISARKKNAFALARKDFNVESYKSELLSLLKNK